MNQIPETEKRHFHRISFEGRASLSLGGVEWTVGLSDVSLHGALVDCPDAVPELSVGQGCVLRVPLAPDLDISMETRVARVEGTEIGLVVERLDLESAQHLKRLVELNLGDGTLLNRDLAALFRS